MTYLDDADDEICNNQNTIMNIHVEFIVKEIQK